MDTSRIIIAADNEHVRSRLTATLLSNHLDPTIINSSCVCEFALTQDDVVLLETSDDVAALSRSVYCIYHSHPGFTPQVIGLVSSLAIKRNPSIAWSDINGKAALAALIRTDSDEIELSLPSYLKRVRSLNSAVAAAA